MKHRCPFHVYGDKGVVDCIYIVDGLFCDDTTCCPSNSDSACGAIVKAAQNLINGHFAGICDEDIALEKAVGKIS